MPTLHIHQRSHVGSGLRRAVLAALIGLLAVGAPSPAPVDARPRSYERSEGRRPRHAERHRSARHRPSYDYGGRHAPRSWRTHRAPHYRAYSRPMVPYRAYRGPRMVMVPPAPRYVARPLVVGPPAYAPAMVVAVPPAPTVVLTLPTPMVAVEPPVIAPPAPVTHYHEHVYDDTPADVAFDPAVAPEVVPSPSADDTAALADDVLVAIEQRVVDRVNEERTRAGLSPVMPDPRLAEAAYLHSAEMYTLGYFSHTSPVAEHAEFTDRLRRVGVTEFGAAGENIAMAPNGEDVADRLVAMWLQSPAHRENLLRPEFRYLGVGVHGDAQTVYATQLFSQSLPAAAR